MNTHWAEQIALHPRSEPLETPIEDPKKVVHEYQWGKYTTTEINKLGG